MQNIISKLSLRGLCTVCSTDKFLDQQKALGALGHVGLPYSNVVPGIVLKQITLDQQAPGHV
jgi:hypothetical protein